jgi:phosphate transport system protein
MELQTREVTDRIRKKTIAMTELVLSAVSSSIRAFLDLDLKAGREVVEKDGEINTLEMDIDKDIFECLALKSPVAGDLRFLFILQKVNKDLERMGDHAVNIAQAAINCAGYGSSVGNPDIKVMVSITESMLSDAIGCFISGDVRLALKVLERDDQVDELNRSMAREVVDMAKQNIATIDVALELLRVSKNLERIADLSTNIAEDVIFQARALDVKHHHLENFSTEELPRP